MIKLASILLFCTLQASQASAETKNDSVAYELESIVKVNSDNKVIQVEKLNLPASTPIKDVLNYLPELVNRKSTYMIANYDIQIDGVSVGDAKDATLAHLHIADVKQIEVNENSLNTITSFGQGGVINIVLKDATKPFEGSAALDVAYVQDLVGGLLIKNKTKKWDLQAIGNVEYYHPGKLTSQFKMGDIVTEDFWTDEHFFSETTKLSAKYHATDRDLLNLNVSNVILKNNWDDNNYYILEDIRNKGVNHLTTCNINAEAEYSHTFRNSSSLTAVTKYTYAPELQKDTVLFPTYCIYNQDIRCDIKAHNIFGKVVYKIPLLTQTKDRSMDMQIGMHSTFRISDNELLYIIEEQNYKESVITLEHNYFLRPFAQLTGKYRALSYNALVDFQHYHYAIGIDGSKDYNTQQNDVTGMASIMWTVNKRNNLRLTYNRSIDRPSGPQLFPYPVMNPQLGRLITGNPELKPSKLNNIDLDYMINLSKRDYVLTLNISSDYTHAYDRIRGKSLSTDYGLNNETYENYGCYNIVRGDLMAYFSRKIFSVALSANIYHCHDKQGTGDEDYTYYNISLSPSLNFRSGWVGAASICYNSKIESSIYETGDQAFANLRIGKSWNHWNVHLFSTVNLINKAVDHYLNEDGRVYATKSYDFMKYEIGIGTRYEF